MPLPLLRASPPLSVEVPEMYAAIWRVLPGTRWVKLCWALVLFLIVVAILFAWVFPAIAPLLPFDRVSVDGALAPPIGETNGG